MKKLLMLFFALPLLFACEKERPDIPEPGDPVTVTVKVKGSVETKATGIEYANEAKVNSLQVFIFHDDYLEARTSASEQTSVVIPATSGKRTVWAVVNAPDLFSALERDSRDPMTLSKLKGHLSTLAGNTKDNFLMSGFVEVELEDAQTVEVTVKRHVCRVSINKISTSWRDYRDNYSVRLEKIYLINVPGNVRYDMTGEPSVWINPNGLTDYDFNHLLCDDYSREKVIIRNNKYQRYGVDIREYEAYTPESIASGHFILQSGVTVVEDNSHSVEHVFYPYPNPYPEDLSKQEYPDTWSPRGTLLVIEATVVSDRDDDKDGFPDVIYGYYPIALPAMERNKRYSIEELWITRIPGNVPGRPIEVGEAKIQVVVSDWETGEEMGTISI